MNYTYDNTDRPFYEKVYDILVELAGAPNGPYDKEGFVLAYTQIEHRATEYRCCFAFGFGASSGVITIGSTCPITRRITPKRDTGSGLKSTRRSMLLLSKCALNTVDWWWPVMSPICEVMVMSESKKFIGFHEDHELPVKRGDTVTILKGTQIRTTMPRPEDKVKVATRTYKVKVRMVLNGCTEKKIRQNEDGAFYEELIHKGNPTIEWSGTGGYWHGVDINDLPEAQPKS